MFNAQLIIAALVGSIILATGSFVGGVKYEKGQEARREVAAQQLQNRSLVRQIDNRDDARRQAELTARKASEGYAKELETVRGERDAAITGGLRITASVCAPGPTPAAEATGAGRPDEDTPGTVALPADVERKLLDLAKYADEVTAQARALQNWIRDNGFYGP